MRKPVKTYDPTVHGGDGWRGRLPCSGLQLSGFARGPQNRVPSKSARRFSSRTRRGAERHDDCDHDVWRRRRDTEKSRFCSRLCAPFPSVRRASIRRAVERRSTRLFGSRETNIYEDSLAAANPLSLFPYIVLLIDGKPSRKTVSSVVYNDSRPAVEQFTRCYRRLRVPRAHVAHNNNNNNNNIVNNILVESVFFHPYDLVWSEKATVSRLRCLFV